MKNKVTEGKITDLHFDNKNANNIDYDNINSNLDNANKILSQLGMPQLVFVKPADCLPQKKNAHYFKPELFQQLVNNIKADNCLASTPLIKAENDKFRTIDGSHRIKAAKEAGIPYILAFLYQPKCEDDEIAKQLSYNFLVGQDDNIILAELFDSIKKIDYKISTGINSDITKINYTSLNFKISAFKELTFLFIPTDIDNYDNIYNEIAENVNAKSSSEVRVTDINLYDKFIDILIKVKKIDNIKNNGTALLRVLEYAQMFLDDIEGQI